MVAMTLHRQVKKDEGGFTLIELAVVILIIAMIGAVVVPQFLPLIAFSQLEGTARRLGNYGRGAIAQATMLRQDITVRIDLSEQEFYAVRWRVPGDETEGEPQEDYLEKLRDFRIGSDMSSGEISDMLARGELGNVLGGFDAELADMQMDDRFARWHRSITLARADNITHDEGMLADIGNFSDKFAFNLRDDEEEPVEEEIFDTVLQRSHPLGQARIERVIVDGDAHTSGVVEIELTPLGLVNDVWMHVTDGSEYYTVHWDPVTGNVNVMEGRI